MTQNPDHHIDRVLTGLRNTTAPTHLEARIHARLAQAEALPTSPRSLKAGILNVRPSSWKIPSFPLSAPKVLAAAAAACASIILAITFTHHQQPPVTINVASQPSTTTAAIPTIATTRAPHGSSLGSHHPSITTASASAPENDPDAIALAETFAPSHPAPPLPLTAQEALLLRSTRQGQPIEIAELDYARAALVHPAAHMREHSIVDEYVHAMLQPLAAAEALSPTPSDEPTASTSSEPPSSK
jgi:hypothetical protein